MSSTAVRGRRGRRYPSCFANAEDRGLRRALASIDAADPPVDWFLLNAEANVEVDLTAVDALEDRRSLPERDIVLHSRESSPTCPPLSRSRAASRGPARRSRGFGRHERRGVMLPPYAASE
jgi:hypothetical protein